MTHRSDRIHLHPREPRCMPANTCRIKTTCARYMAAMPAQGGSMMGGGMPPLQWAQCASYLGVNQGGTATAEKAPAKPAVKGLG